MSKLFFFTDINQVNNQNSEDSFGPMMSEGGFDRFQLENRVLTSQDAPAIAVCKSLLLAQEDAENSELLNIALLPIVPSELNNIPIKFFIYRGILRNSLYDSNGNILTSTNMRSEKNIVSRIQEIQNKINLESGISNTATKKYLGCELEGNPYLEQAFFMQSDTVEENENEELFHPIIVEGGFEIGKFKGGSSKAGIQLVLDKIGYEPKIELLRKPTDIFSAAILPENSDAVSKFKDRTKREKILAYMDYCGFIGSFSNSNQSKINSYNQTSQEDSNVNINDVLDKFHNKNTVYFDLRDDYGNSFNHFFKTADVLKIYAKSPSSGNDFVLNEANYYQSKWPILQLKDYQVKNSSFNGNEKIKISFPINVGTPIIDYTIYSYTANLGKSRFSKIKFDDNATDAGDYEITLNYSTPIEIPRLAVNGGKFAANYLLFKFSDNKGQIVNPSAKDAINNVFPLHMKNILGDENLEDGDFQVYVYSSLNSPIIVKGGNKYLVNIGIAKDKNNITFFMYNSLSLKSNNAKAEERYSDMFTILANGKDSYQMYIDEFEYESDQSLGFLSALPYKFLNSSGFIDFDLQEFHIDGGTYNYNALTYMKVGTGTSSDAFFRDFDAACITHIEYRELLKKIIRPASSSDYESNFENYLQNYYACLSFESSTLSETIIEDGKIICRFHPVYIDFTDNPFNELIITGKPTDQYFNAEMKDYFYLRTAAIAETENTMDFVNIERSLIKVDIPYSSIQYKN